MRNRLVAVIFALAALSISSAQIPPSSILSLESYLELQAAAAFTDGYAITCPDIGLTQQYLLCVNTSGTGWTAAQLRDWSDYGLGRWVTMQTWTLDSDGNWLLSLAHAERTELIVISVSGDGRRVLYLAGKIQ